MKTAPLASVLHRGARFSRRGWLAAVAFSLLLHPGVAAASDNIPVQFRELETGSRIGYVHVASTATTKRGTLVFVHGGPGACEVYAYSFAHSWYERLAAQGFDVVLYDQIGGGFSARLADPRDYTLERHLADLEAIRRAIGCEQMTLIGESHGATLAASYIAAHPDRVAQAVFVAPGAIESAERKRGAFTYPAPEFSTWIFQTRGAEAARRYKRLSELLQQDVLAAYRFAGDAEMDPLFNAFVKETILVKCVHDPVRIREREFEVPDMGWWAGRMTAWDEYEHHRSVKSRLSQSPLPVLILRGDSDFVPARAAEEYAATFGNSKLIRIPAAGHFIWMDQPERYRDEIETFLTGATSPNPSSHDPH